MNTKNTIFFLLVLNVNLALFGNIPQKASTLQLEANLRGSLEGTIRGGLQLWSGPWWGWWESDDALGRAGIQSPWITAGPLRFSGLRTLKSNWEALTAQSRLWREDPRIALTRGQGAYSGVGLHGPQGKSGLWVQKTLEGWRALGGWFEGPWGLDLEWSESPLETPSGKASLRPGLVLEGVKGSLVGGGWADWPSGEMGGALFGQHQELWGEVALGSGLKHESGVWKGWLSFHGRWEDLGGVWTMRVAPDAGYRDYMGIFQGQERISLMGKIGAFPWSIKGEHEHETHFTGNGLLKVKSQSEVRGWVREGSRGWQGSLMLRLLQNWNPSWNLSWKAEALLGWRSPDTQWLGRLQYTLNQKPLVDLSLQALARSDWGSLELSAGWQFEQVHLHLGPKGWNPRLEIRFTTLLHK